MLCWLRKCSMKFETRLEHLSCKSLAQLVQQTQLHIQWLQIYIHAIQNKIVSVTEEGDYGRSTHFQPTFQNWKYSMLTKSPVCLSVCVCKRFLRQTVHDGVLDPKLTFFTDKAWFHLSGYISAKNNRYWSSINTDFWSDPSLVYGVPLLLYE
jgi:hypothetical protein